MKNRHDTIAAWLFLLPNFLGFLVFTSLPVLASAALSFFQWDLYTAPRFVGFRNFWNLLGFHSVSPDASRLLLFVFTFAALLAVISGINALIRMLIKARTAALISFGIFVVCVALLMILNRPMWSQWEANDANFWKYFYNTVFLMAVIPLDIFGALMLAILMNQKLRGVYGFRLVFFLPSIVSGVGTYLLWKWLLNKDAGAINGFLALLHIPPSPWLDSVYWAKPALMLMGFWGAVGGHTMILYIAALSNVSPELYEAAEIDGANGVQKFWAVTWPMVAPTTFFVFVMSIIGGFQSGFDAAYVMTGGGPAGSTTTLSFYIYNEAFSNNHMGYAAAISWFLFIIVFCVTMANLRFGGRVVSY